MWTGWATFAGTEIINNERAAAYGAPVTCRCPDLPAWLGDAPYTTPAADDAPWIDPYDPATTGFLGIVGLGMPGLQTAPVQRTVTELLGNGGALGNLRYGSRATLVRAAAFARDECALAAGLAWLDSVLQGAACGAGCYGETMCFASCCPTAGSGDDLVRSLYGVGITDGVERTGTRRWSGGVYATIEFTLTAANPWIWRPETLVGTADVWTAASDFIDPFPVPPSVPDCLADPLCPVPPSPPAPPRQVDACYPRDLYPYKYARIPVPADASGTNLAAAPIITINTGSGVARRVMVKWMSNPLRKTCDEVATETDDWQACSVAYIGYVPAGTTLTIDARNRRATVTCPGQPASNANPKLLGVAGGPYSWPVIDCAVPACVEVSAWSQWLAADATVTVSLAEREGLG